jgi:hypothetical protein
MPQFGDNMPKFQDLNGSIFEVSEEHADQVLRPQNAFKEVFEEKKSESKDIIEEDLLEEIPKPSKKKVTKKKAKKKVN